MSMVDLRQVKGMTILRHPFSTKKINSLIIIFKGLDDHHTLVENCLFAVNKLINLVFFSNTKIRVTFLMTTNSISTEESL